MARTGGVTLRRALVAVTAVALVAAGAAVAWRRYDGGSARAVGVDSAVPGADGRSLVVRYLAGSPGCGDPVGVGVEESATEVRLTARVEHARGDGVPCPLAGRVVTETVRLRAPLGDRAVVDARSGRRLPGPAPSQSERVANVSQASGEPPR